MLTSRAAAALFVAFTLVLPMQAGAAVFGWYYESFDWKALQAYLGNGSRREKREFHRHLEDLLLAEAKQPRFNLQASSGNVKLWKGFIDGGLRYSKLDLEQAQFADRVIATIMNPAAELRALAPVSQATADYYVHPAALRSFRPLVQQRSQELIDLFEYGRSWGNPRRRTQCVAVDEDPEWLCHGAYVIFSPDEAAALSEDLLQVLDSPSFVDDKMEKQKYVRSFAAALGKAAEAGRGMYVHSTSD